MAQSKEHYKEDIKNKIEALNEAINELRIVMKELKKTYRILLENIENTNNNNNLTIN